MSDPKKPRPRFGYRSVTFRKGDRIVYTDSDWEFLGIEGPERKITGTLLEADDDPWEEDEVNQNCTGRAWLVDIDEEDDSRFIFEGQMRHARSNE